MQYYTIKELQYWLYYSYRVMDSPILVDLDPDTLYLAFSKWKDEGTPTMYFHFVSLFKGHQAPEVLSLAPGLLDLSLRSFFYVKVV